METQLGCICVICSSRTQPEGAQWYSDASTGVDGVRARTMRYPRSWGSAEHSRGSRFARREGTRGGVCILEHGVRGVIYEEPA